MSTRTANPPRDIRPSPLAGQWYPADAGALRTMLHGFLASAAQRNKPINGRVIGLLAPHAGHRYSGPIAATAFNLIRGLHFDTVVVIGPLHHPIPGRVLTSAHRAYSTPLGVMSVDQDFLRDLDRVVPLTPIRSDPEHSVEIEIPFLQMTLDQPDQTTLIPLMLRDQSAALAERLGAALAERLARRRALLVASSDLSHFYSRQDALELDTALLEKFTEFDPDGVIAVDEQGLGYACGRGAIATMLHAARQLGANHAEVVGYGTSGDVTGDMERVVGYGAGVISAQ